MMKLLLLGIGRWGANHLRVLHSLPIELYVAELDGKRLEAARKLGIPDARLSTRYKDFAGLVDAAVIVTPAQISFPALPGIFGGGQRCLRRKTPDPRAGGVQATRRTGGQKEAHPASRPHFPLRSGHAMDSRRHSIGQIRAGQHPARTFWRIQTPAQRQRRHVRRRHSFCRSVQLFSQRHPGQRPGHSP